MDDLYRALVLITGGFFFVTLIALAIRIWRIPNDVWEKERQRIKEQHAIARTIAQFFEGK